MTDEEGGLIGGVKDGIVQAIRGGKLEKVVRNLEQLMSERLHRGLDRPVVGFSITVLKGTRDHLGAILALYRKLGLDGGITLNPLQQMKAYTQYYDEAMQAEALPREEAQEMRLLFVTDAEVRRIQASRGATRGFYDELMTGWRPTRRNCPWLDRGLYVNRNGSAAACCMVKDSRHAFGRIGIDSPSRILAGRERLREQLARGETPEPCVGCELARYALMTKTQLVRSGVKGTRDGWLNRYLDAKQTEDPAPLRAVSLGAKLPRLLQGSASAVALSNIRDFRLGRKSQAVEQAFTRMYGEMPTAANVQRVIHETSDDTFAALQLLKGLDPNNYRPADGAEYPRNRFGQSLKQIAQLIKADVGVEVAFADSGGWDTHTNEAPQLNNLLGNLGGALSAFAADLGSRMQEVLVVTMSEFGRTARENGNCGTDHGHANAMFAIGGGVKGGKVYGKWPGLAEEDLYEGRDLALTSDFRDVFAEALDRHMGAEKLDPVFPGYSPKRKKFLGFLKG